MSSDTVRIATRKSLLALWQAEYIQAGLRREHPGLNVELVGLSTKGDQMLDSPLAKIGGKGLFIKELEQAMLAGEADMAVHSMKDVPMELPEGFELPVICEREDPRDAFVSNHYRDLDTLPLGSRVGTSSLRRECQLRALRPDLDVRFLRGNVQTRLRKLDDGEFDAIILATAGLLRLELDVRIASRLPVSQSLPAVGQGAVGVEIRQGDERLRELLAPLHHPESALLVGAERAMNRRLEGGCQVPIAGYAIRDPDDSGSIWLRGLVGEPDGRRVLRAEARGRDPRALGVAVAEDLLGQGAGDILAAVYGAQ